MAEPETIPDTLPENSPATDGRVSAPRPSFQHRLKVLGTIITIVASIGLILKGLLGYFDVYHFASELIQPAKTHSNAALAVANTTQLSIAVVPFENISTETTQAALSQAITQAVAVHLSHVPDYVAKSASKADRDKSPQQIGKELGVNYVLEGSVQRLNERVAISVQLIDTNDGAQLWTDRFEDVAGDVFDLQDAIAGRISNSLDIEMVKAAGVRLDAKNLQKPNAEYYAIKGRIAFHKLRTKENLQQAQALFQRALALNPNQFDALVFLPLALDFEILNFADEQKDEKAKLALEVADRAVQLNPTSGWAHGAKAQSFTPYGRYPEWIQECETAISLNSSLTQPRVLLAAGRFRTGEFAAAIAAGKQAIRISPKDPGIAYAWLHVGNSYAGMHRYDEAVKWLEQMRTLSPLVWRPHASLAVAYALQGNTEGAHQELAEARRLFPQLSGNAYTQILQFKKPPIPGKEAPFIEFRDLSAKVLHDLGLPDK